jgi:ribonuclease HII
VGRLSVPRGLRLQLDPDDREETDLRRRGHRLVAGVDEVGRGCLAGPVVAGAVILPADWGPAGLRDSKLLDAPTRERLAEQIQAGAIAWAVAAVDAPLIDGLNILQATLLASLLALARLAVRPDAAITDSLHLPDARLTQRVLVDADRRCRSVAAASVVAKVYRDRLMTEYEQRYPGYGFAVHKGYAAPEHRSAIERLGLSPIHRRTFGSCVDVPDAAQVALWPEAEPTPA